MPSGPKTSLSIALTADSLRALKSWQRSTTISAGLARRARIILLLSSGASVSEVSRTVGIERRLVYKWAHRFIQKGVHGLRDKTGRGRKPEKTTPRANQVSTGDTSLPLWPLLINPRQSLDAPVEAAEPAVAGRRSIPLGR